MKNKKEIIITNLVTSIRMVGILLLTPIYLLYGGVALGLTNMACFLTDALDGQLARRLNASTFFGSFYDGLSDKMFLATNLAILCTITPWAILPIGLELGIMGVQYNKYKKNLKVKSNLFGKAKMWVAGVSVVLSNLLIDASKLQFLGDHLISKITQFSDANIVKGALLPVVMAETLTLASYIFESVKENSLPCINAREEKLSEIAPAQNEEGKQDFLKDSDMTLQEMLFSHEFYEAHKNDGGLRLLRERAKNTTRRK